MHMVVTKGVTVVGNTVVGEYSFCSDGQCYRVHSSRVTQYTVHCTVYTVHSSCTQHTQYEHTMQRGGTHYVPPRTLFT
jgi:hypothetical protein